MFGMGGSEIIVILIVALLFLGPEKLPEAAKTISKGIRDIKKQSRTLQQSIENDEVVGGAIRDLKSALRGDEPAVRPKPLKPLKRAELPTAETAVAGVAALPGSGEPGSPAGAPTLGTYAGPDAASADLDGAAAVRSAAESGGVDKAVADRATAADSAVASSGGVANPATPGGGTAAPTGARGEAPGVDSLRVKLPPTAGEPDPDVVEDDPGGPDDLASLVRPAPGAIARDG